MLGVTDTSVCEISALRLSSWKNEARSSPRGHWRCTTHSVLFTVSGSRFGSLVRMLPGPLKVWNISATVG